MLLHLGLLLQLGPVITLVPSTGGITDDIGDTALETQPTE